MTKTILFLAANPITTDRLRLDAEFRDIEESIRRARQGIDFHIVQKGAVRREELRRAILDYDPEPEIVHFSGHGAGSEGIILEDDLGQPSIVSTSALQEFFALFPKVRCVVLNACFTKVQAEAIAKSVRYVIGTEQQISDDAAKEFSISFYDALGAGRSIEFAHRVGCASLSIIGETVLPVLIQRQLPLAVFDDLEPSDDGELPLVGYLEPLTVSWGLSSRIVITKSEILIGRAPDCDGIIIPPPDNPDNTLVSRKHVRIQRHPDGFKIEDIGSTHGTFVNTIPMKANRPRYLGSGDVITLGGRQPNDRVCGFKFFAIEVGKTPKE